MHISLADEEIICGAYCYSNQQTEWSWDFGQALLDAKDDIWDFVFNNSFMDWVNNDVLGIGGNSRIVLWDTTLKRLSDEEILFIMAHEMGHYVMKDIYIGIAVYLWSTLIGLWLIAKIMPWIIRRYGSMLKIKQLSNINSLPLFLLISSILVFFSSPLSNAVSRYQEVRAE